MNLQRGAGSGLVIAIIMVLAMAGLVAAIHGGWLASGQRARSAADIVALAAAQAHADGADGCAQGGRAAEQNRARLVECELTSGYGEFVIDITVEVEVLPAIPDAPRTARASARAGIVSDVSGG
ncbi:helicase/secretion neighborhood TadE-like protein [Propionibacterium sp. oral taxon 192 str. F0372]|uniref:Rv3654c family TadE-like protein n=1 Tax=Propionibacterium sp. oral taxon 192 TaxID=671222 RepID=UPI0003541ACC|nr:Rv3654c family TadE-like protein [Propionibacterium sp. oral taxon 192]EPH03238.1 helicase/secretion neighborhood TadE-like protein [Propionibacterium sp. oral taxon 192 str. F0372]